VTYPQIIGLNGVARAGKDTVAGILHQLYGYEVFSYSETLNDALYTLDRECGEAAGVYIPLLQNFGRDTVHERYADLIDRVGYEAAKEYAGVRTLLQVMGTEVGRRLFGENVWVDALMKKIEGKPRVVITNVRFPNEAEAVWSRGGEVWEVTRPGYKPALGHISDTALEAIIKDKYIHNDGTERELADKVMAVMDDPLRVGLQRAFAQ
jgi:hypothetical protein